MSSKTSCEINAKNTSCCNNNEVIVNYKSHWDTVYAKGTILKLGWYEKKSTPILKLINETKIKRNDSLFVVGAGSTTLIDSLLQNNYANITANDISKEGLESLQKRLGINSEKIEWIVDDLINPTHLKNMDKVKLWIDRAVLHFFIDNQEQDNYFKLLKEKVAVKGFVILAEFNLNSATKCSGLPVKRYDAKMLSSKLGSNFELLNTFDYIYTMPNKDKRDYVYTLFKRID